MSLDLVLQLEIPMLNHGASILLGVVGFAYLYYFIKWIVSLVMGG